MQSADRIPRDRLNQIAERRLKALGLEALQFDASGTELRGILVFRTHDVPDPITKVRLAEAPFRVAGHDHLAFLQPPLSGLAPVAFYDAETQAEIEERIFRALSHRLVRLQDVARKFAALQLGGSLDTARLAIVALMETSKYQFEVLGDGFAVRVARVREPRGPWLELDARAAAIRLEDFMTRSDVEIFLSRDGDRLRALLPVEQEKAPSRSFEIVPPAPNALTIELLERFGRGATVRLTDRLEVVRDFRIDGVHYRFVALHDSGITFRGKLTGPGGEKWSDRFDLSRFPGIAPLVRMVLGIPEEEEKKPAAPQQADEAPPTLSTQLGGLEVPDAGEVWVMNVLIEGESATEIRYVCTNTNGQPFGAPRVLPKADFPRVFTQYQSGWRLRVLVDAVGESAVTYRQVDAEGQPRGSEKKIALAIFTSTFIPEAAAY